MYIYMCACVYIKYNTHVHMHSLTHSRVIDVVATHEKQNSGIVGFTLLGRVGKTPPPHLVCSDFNSCGLLRAADACDTVVQGLSIAPSAAGAQNSHVCSFLHSLGRRSIGVATCLIVQLLLKTHPGR